MHARRLREGLELKPLRRYGGVPDRCSFEGCELAAASRGLCGGHYSQWHRGEALKEIDRSPRPSSRVNKQGYVEVRLPKGHPCAHAAGWGFEHRVVMMEQIGRPLDPAETVHHRNGVRHDNRPENLELWTSRHPKGQRVEDVVEFAKEILRLYG